MIRIVLVEDQAQVRRGLQMNLCLEPDFAIVGEAHDGDEALQLAGALQPDVVVLDIAMPTLDGISVAAALSANQPRCAVVILTIHDDAHTQARAYAAGAAAFVSKRESPERLTVAIRQVARQNVPI